MIERPENWMNCLCLGTWLDKVLVEGSPRVENP